MTEQRIQFLETLAWRWAGWLSPIRVDTLINLLPFVLLGLFILLAWATERNRICYESRPLHWEVLEQVPPGERGYSCTTR